MKTSKKTILVYANKVEYPGSFENPLNSNLLWLLYYVRKLLILA